MSMERKQYLIEVGGTPGPCFYVQPGDEDDVSQLQTTSDSTLASRWDDFVGARKELRQAVVRHPNREFKLGVVDEVRLLLDRSMAVMKALHESAEPDESTEGVPCVIQPKPFREFVDAHAELLYAVKQLGNNVAREVPNAR